MRAILTLSWHSVAYGVGILGAGLVVYILLPFLTHYMPREEYGVVSVVTSLYAFLNVLTNAGLPSATYRYFNNSEAEEDRRSVLGASQFLFFLFAALPAVGILFYSKPLSMILLSTEQYSGVFQVVAGYLVINSMNNFGTIILRIEVRPLVSSLYSILSVICNIGFALLFVITYHLGVLGYWLGFLVGEAGCLVIMFWLVRKRIVFRISWHRVIQLIKFGAPLIPSTLSMTALQLLDRYIIGYLAGLEQVAIYDVGYKIGSVILLIVSPFRTAWVPFAFSISQKPEAPRVYKDVLTYLMAGSSMLVLGVVAFRSQLVEIIAPASYGDAVAIVGWVAVSQVFLAAYFVLSMAPMIANKPHQLVWVVVFASGVNLLLNFILIPSMGILGAAVATFVGYAVLAIFAYFIGRRSFDLKIDWLRMSKLVLAVGFAWMIILISEQLITITWVEIVVKLLGLSSFPGLLILTRFLNPAQVRSLLDMGRNLMDKKIYIDADGRDGDSSL